MLRQSPLFVTDITQGPLQMLQTADSEHSVWCFPLQIYDQVQLSIRHTGLVITNNDIIGTLQGGSLKFINSFQNFLFNMSHFSLPQKVKPWMGSGKPVLAIPVPWEFKYGRSKRPNNPGKRLLFATCSEHKHRQGPFPILLSVLSWSHYRFHFQDTFSPQCPMAPAAYRMWRQVMLIILGQPCSPSSDLSWESLFVCPSAKLQESVSGVFCRHRIDRAWTPACRKPCMSSCRAQTLT